MKAWFDERLVALLLAIVMTACGTGPQPEVPAATLAITDVTLIDGTGAGAQAAMTVLIAGDRITAVGPADELPAPAGAQIIDGHGRFLIPGLWDAHVHLAYDAAPAIPPEYQLALYLAYGVVAVRDMGSDWQRIETLRQGL